MQTDVLIVGSGCAGLYCALNLPKNKNILMITKDIVEHSDSYLAQGGMCMLKDPDDFDSYFYDTMKAGHFENDTAAVETMIKESPDLVKDLLSYGVDFQRDEDGNLAYTREGAHARNRIVYHEDITGKEITSHLYEQCKKLDNLTIKEHWTMVDLLTKDNCCYGVVVRKDDGSLDTITANYTVLACGGIGGIYRYSTNYRHLTGDGIAVALKHGVELKNVNYVQIHPTTFYSEKEEDRSFLISESVRGEGAKLYNNSKERFTEELLPRDILTSNIRKEMKREGSEHVWLSMKPIDPEQLKEHFPNIVEHCKEKGYDVFKEPIPVVPAQHYFMGGIKVDYDSHTSMKHLYAIGETACNGVHGKNRLASNSLLESLVFAKRAAKRIEKSLKERAHYMFDQTTLKLNVDPLIISALKEDITSEDVSTNSVMPFSKTGVVDLICKEDGIICGLQIFERTFELLDEACDVEFFASDGDRVEKGQLLGRVKGDVRILLSGERVALNYLQRMSGIATYTANVQKYLKDSSIRLLDTRKTTPNNRIFEKYAVRVGGGHNHRYNLSDGVLLKDNHIGAAGGVKEAIMLAKEYAPFVRKIEIEVENMEMVKEAVEAGADIIMLDNMDDDMLKEAIAYIDHRAEIEVSGNVTKENIARLTNLGVDYVSSGALTHSAPILDLSLKNLHVL